MSATVPSAPERVNSSYRYSVDVRMDDDKHMVAQIAREQSSDQPTGGEGPATRTTDRLYRCEAIVLNRLDFGEADRILTLYSRQRGKLRVIAKGARRPLSRLGPHLEFFCRSNLMLARGRELDVVTGAETLDAHLEISGELEAYGHASHMAEILSRLTEDRQENVQVFDLLASSLRLLADGVEPFHVTRHYDMALLALLGFRPELYRCVECGETLAQAPHQFAATLGGFLCERCYGREHGARIVSVDAQKYLRSVDRRGLGASVRIRLDETLKAELEGLFTEFLRHIAERDLGSLRVWREIRDSIGEPYR
jgi:DNA repair protein RecO (recombination protein O)